MTRLLHLTWRLCRAAAGLAIAAVLLAGVPYLLLHLVGSPLPHHMPTWPQTRMFLTSPLSDDAIIDGLADVAWLIWLVFVLAVIIQVAAEIRGRPAPQLPGIAPIQAITATLLGATVLAAVPMPQLSPRAIPLHPNLASQPVATASRHPGVPTVTSAAAAETMAYTQSTSHVNADLPAVAHPLVHRVVPGDNLWDIAKRYLGSGERWHELYELNRGKPQPDGKALTDPAFICPGWVLLLPPATANRPPPPAESTQPNPRSTPAGTSSSHPPPHPVPAKPSTQPGSAPQPGGHSTGAAPHHPGAIHHQGRRAAVSLPGGGLVGITLAAAVSAAIVTWRLHRRRVATARWPIPQGTSEPGLPDSISRLRRAQLDSAAADDAETHGEAWIDETDETEGIDEFGAPTGPDFRSPSVSEAGRGYIARHAQGSPPSHLRSAHRPPPASPLPAGTITFGIRGNAEIPLDTLAAHGLGLTGQGAPAAARALAIGLLAAGGRGLERDRPQVVIPQADAQQLIPEQVIPGTGSAAAPGLPNLIITESIEAALDHIEAEIASHLRLAEASAAPSAGIDRRTAITVALLARPSYPVIRRLRAVLEAGASVGVIGVLLGSWEPGVTCSIRDDGVVTAAAGADLTGVQTFHLPGRDAAAFLTLLQGAHGHVTDDRPGTPVPLQPAAPPHPVPKPSPDTHTVNDPSGFPLHPGNGLAGNAAPGNRPQPSGKPPAEEPRLQQPGPPEPEPKVQPTSSERRPVAADHAQPPAPLPAPVTPAPVAPAVRARAVQVHLLGPLQIEAGGQEVITGLRRSARELLAFLALFSEGATGERVTAALWPDHPPESARIALQTGLRSLRVTLRTATGAAGPMFVIHAAGRYRIDRNLVDADLWRFRAALKDADQALRNIDPAAERESLSRAVESYRGPLAEDAPYEWVEPYREEIRRQAVDAFTRLAGMHEPAESEQALALLDRALTHDTVNEQLHQRIMTIQARLGRTDAIHRTVKLLENHLADLGLTPSGDTYALAAHLQRPQLASTTAAAGPPVADSHEAPAASRLQAQRGMTPRRAG